MNIGTFLQVFTDPVTMVFLVVSFVLFGYYLRKVLQVDKCNKELRSAASGNNILENLKKLHSIKLIAKNYERSICFEDENGKKRTSGFASDYFNLLDVLSVKRINRQAMGAAAGILVGIGVLGTFVGLSLAVAEIKMGANVDIQAMWSSINTLLGGMKIAFVTSVAGMFLSSIYTFFEKIALNNLTKTCALVSDKLDDQYYISELEKQNIEINRRNELFLKQIGTIVHDIKSIDDDANELTIGNMLRDIKQCNENQVNAINCVAEEVCNGLGDRLKELGDRMVDAISDPKGGLAGGVIEQLNTAINEMLIKLNESVDKGAGSKLEELGSQLQSASESLKLLPSVLSDLTNRLRADIEQIEGRVTSMNEASAQVGVNLAEKQGMLNAQTEKLVDGFNEGIQKSCKMLEAMSNTLNQLASVQQQISVFYENMKATSSSVKSAVDNLDSAQSGFMQETNETFKNIRQTNEDSVSITRNIMNEVRNTIQQTNASTGTLIGESKKLAHTYTQEFEKIRSGMGGIFDQMRKGLDGYSDSVKENTGNILASYSKEVNKAIQNLYSLVQQLSLIGQPK